MPNVRKSAFDVICRVFYDDAYSAIALNSVIKEKNYTKLDSSFLSRLVYGVIERKILLDYIISQYSKIKPKNIERKTLVILEMGIFQLLFMDKVPESAAVNESVKLSKKVGAARSAGFINAVLRNFVRNNKKYSLPIDTDTTLYLSVKYSCPEYIVSLWLSQYGEDITKNILEGINGRPPFTVRVNTLKTSKKELMSELEDLRIICSDISFLPSAFNVENTGSIENMKQFKDGKFYIQDSASQLCCEMIGAKPGDTVCDVCAAPGGKSLCCAINMNNSGKVYSYDLYPHKIKLIKDSCDRLGVNIINAEVRDSSKPDSNMPKCDRLLCDVPCSGLGIIRRKPEIRYKKATNIDNLPKLQYDILCCSSENVSIGGVLVYSTCTLNDKENADVVDKFLKEHPDYVPEPLVLPDGFERFIDEPEHMLTLLPYRSCSDGFFIAKLRKVK